MCSCMFASAGAATSIIASRVLQRLEVAKGESAIFEQIGNEKTRRAAKEVQQVAHEPATMLALVHGRLKELSIADLLHFAERAFLFKPIDERLHGRVGHTFVIWKALQHLAYRRSSQLPVLLHDAGFGLRKTRRLHES